MLCGTPKLPGFFSSLGMALPGSEQRPMAAKLDRFCCDGFRSHVVASGYLKVTGKGPDRTQVTTQRSQTIWGHWEGPYQVLSKVLGLHKQGRDYCAGFSSHGAALGLRPFSLNSE